jgi:hypothetical protein
MKIPAGTWRNVKDDSLQRMVDALREVLDLEPLYDRSYKSNVERFYIPGFKEPVPLRGMRRTD